MEKKKGTLGDGIKKAEKAAGKKIKDGFKNGFKKAEEKIGITPRDESFIVKIIRQSLPILIAVAFVEALAGALLGGMIESLLLIPGLIILVPPIMDLRGNINTALGSRISNALSLKIIDPKLKHNKILMRNVTGAVINGVSIAIIIGLFAHFASVLLGLPSAGFEKLVLISILASIVSMAVLIPSTIFIVFYAFKKNIDPDNILAPSLSIFGDLVGISALMLIAKLVIGTSINPLLTLPLFGLMVGSKLNGMSKRKLDSRKKLRKHYGVKNIFLESLPVLIVCIFLSGAAGLLLHSRMEGLKVMPGLLILVPQIIAMGGGIGGILGARLSSALDSGSVVPFKMNKIVKDNLISVILLGYIKSIAIGLIAFGMASLLGLANPGLLGMLALSLIAGTVVIIVILLLDTFVAFYSFKKNIDPSNTTIPIITSMTDMIGTFALIGGAILLGMI